MKLIAKFAATFAIAMASTGAFASANTFYATGNVISAEPQVRVIKGKCYTDNRTEKNTAGAVFGAVFGAAVGNQIGGGSGKDIATAAGAVIGSTVLGNQPAGTGETYCDADTPQITGYSVAYELNGVQLTTTTRQHPGSTIKVRLTVTPMAQ